MLSMFWATFWAVVAAEAAVGFIVVVGMLILLSLLQYVTRSRTDESRDESLCELWGEVFDLQKEDDKLRRQNNNVVLLSHLCDLSGLDFLFINLTKKILEAFFYYRLF